jgi:hypothetical protein
MTEKRAIGLIAAGGVVLETVSLIGLYLLGIPGTGLSLGALIPVALTSYAASRVVVHYGEGTDRHKH